MTNPPADPEAEMLLIGACLLGGVNAFVRAAPLVTEHAFSEGANRAAFVAMSALHERGEAIDFASVSGEIRRVAPDEQAGVHLVDCIGTVPTSANVETYARRLAFVGAQRSVFGLSASLLGVAMEPRVETAEEVIAKAYGEFDRVLRNRSGRAQIGEPQDIAHSYFETVDRRQQHDPSAIGYPTGFADLDKVLALRMGELWYVAAPPGAGKTSFLQNIQENIARRGVPSLFASVEQPIVQLMDRAVASDTRIDSWRIARGDLNTYEWQQISESLERRMAMPIYVSDTIFTTADLAAALHLAKARYDIRVCFVDYVQLLADEYGENENGRVGYISRRLTMLAKQLGICIVAASQISRNYSRRADKTIELSDLRDSGRLEQDAFVVLALRREEENDTVAHVDVKKNRNGAAGVTVDLHFDMRFTKFSNLSRASA